MTTETRTTIIAPARRTEAVGEYYFSRKLAAVRALDSAELPVINLGIGSPDLPPPAPAIGALQKGLGAADAHRYQSYRGVPALRRAIAHFSRRLYGTVLDPETEILPLIGSKEGLLHIALAFVDAGDEVLIPDPGYPTYRAVTELAGGVPISYALRADRGWAIDVHELERRDLSRVKMMWVNLPHMPTGRAASREELAALVALARRHGFLLVNDNPYGGLAAGEPVSILSVEGAEEIALELSSVSKTHNMAGWRVGWMSGSAPLIDTVLRVRSNADSGMFLPIQLGVAEALMGPDAWIRDLRATYARRRAIGNDLLRTLGCSVSDGQEGVFVWAKAPAAVARVEEWLDALLRETRVFLTPGFIFGEGGARYVRLSLCAPGESIREAAARIARFVSTARRAS